MKVKFGFTLAEVLICLGILGVITAFMIPKVLVVQQDSQCRAVLKETISVLSEVVYEEAVSKKTIYWNGSQYNSEIIQNRVNATKICATNLVMDGCWDSSIPEPPSYGNPGFILPSGAIVVGPGVSRNAYSRIGIDCNGVKGPNKDLMDQILVNACYDPNGCDDGTGQIFRFGTIYPDRWGASGMIDYQPYYEELFTRK